jgi:hypothetical protein
LLSIASSRAAVRVPAAAPPPLAGDFPGQSSSTNRSRASPIDDPRRLFACPHSTSLPASLPSPSGPRGGGGAKGIFVKDLKVLGSSVHKDCSLFCGLIQQVVKLIKNLRKIQK